jgi:hypothetical protein
VEIREGKKGGATNVSMDSFAETVPCEAVNVCGSGKAVASNISGDGFELRRSSLWVSWWKREW